jgi:predicted DNA-binding transcriptional regulator YafY
MQLLKTLRQLEYLDHLIRTKATGTPKNFAERLHLSERQLYRLIEELKDLGLPIYYSVKRVVIIIKKRSR